MSSGTVVSSATRALRVPARRGLGQIFEQLVGLAIPDTVALLDRGVADRLREMALAGAGRAEEERILPLLDEAARRQVVDQRPVHLLVEIEVEAVERPIRVAKPGLLRAGARAAGPAGRAVHR